MPTPVLQHAVSIEPDEWLEAQCHAIFEAGNAMGEIVRTVTREQNPAPTITEEQLEAMRRACGALRQSQNTVQNALIDCELELRDIREREVDPAELLIEGNRLIAQYRFLRRRARVLDGLLGFLPGSVHHGAVCLEHLRKLPLGGTESEITYPDCGFALAALEELREGI